MSSRHSFFRPDHFWKSFFVHCSGQCSCTVIDSFLSVRRQTLFFDPGPESPGLDEKHLSFVGKTSAQFCSLKNLPFYTNTINTYHHRPLNITLTFQRRRRDGNGRIGRFAWPFGCQFVLALATRVLAPMHSATPRLPRAGTSARQYLLLLKLHACVFCPCLSFGGLCLSRS